MRLCMHQLLFFFLLSLSTITTIINVMMANSIVKSAFCASSGSRVIYSYADLRRGILISRYKRFLADVEFEIETKTTTPVIESSFISTTAAVCHAELDILDQAAASVVTVVHCPNTGSMYKLIPPDNANPECACSTAPEGTKRKYPNTLEMIKENNAWVGINSALANKMVENALNANLIDGCMNFTSLKREVKIFQSIMKVTKGKLSKSNKTESEESRIDFELSWNENESENDNNNENENRSKIKNVEDFVKKNKKKLINDEKTNRTITNDEVKDDFLNSTSFSNELLPDKLRNSNHVSTNITDIDSDLNSKENSSHGSSSYVKHNSKINKKRNMLLEVKSVTLAMKTENGEWSAQFPDTVSTRGQKHLKVLIDRVQKGGDAGILFLVQRDDCTSFSACSLDPSYGPLLHEAAAAGVQIIPYSCRLNPLTSSVELLGRLPFIDMYADIKTDISTSSIENNRNFDTDASDKIDNKKKKKRTKKYDDNTTIMDMTTYN